jgi:hypothetical protein
MPITADYGANNFVFPWLVGDLQDKFLPQCHAFRQKPSTDVSAESLTLNMNSTRQSRDTDATADWQTTSVVNCTVRGSVAGVSGIGGGTNTSAAGTRNAIGTSTTTTR